jgi:hypothetical protein
MNRSESNASLPRGPAPDLWRHTLSQIPSVFGRLVYLCSLRDPNTGVYQHYGLAQAFAEWLCFPLERQRADLGLYLEGLGDNPRTLLDAWIRLTPYRNLVPAGAREVERKLYLVDLETILELLRNEYGVACPDPDA